MNQKYKSPEEYQRYKSQNIEKSDKKAVTQAKLLHQNILSSRADFYEIQSKSTKLGYPITDRAILDVIESKINPPNGSADVYEYHELYAEHTAALNSSKEHLKESEIKLMESEKQAKLAKISSVESVINADFTSYHHIAHDYIVILLPLHSSHHMFLLDIVKDFAKYDPTLSDIVFDITYRDSKGNIAGTQNHTASFDPDWPSPYLDVDIPSSVADSGIFAIDIDYSQPDGSLNGTISGQMYHIARDHVTSDEHLAHLEKLKEFLKLYSP